MPVPAGHAGAICGRCPGPGQLCCAICVLVRARRPDLVVRTGDLFRSQLSRHEADPAIVAARACRCPVKGGISLPKCGAQRRMLPDGSRMTC